jgi:hypothetical protein
MVTGALHRWHQERRSADALFGAAESLAATQPGQRLLRQVVPD